MARYINVDELLMKIHDEYTISYFRPSKEDMQLIGIFEIINAQPTADVAEMKHGRWINGVCSNCRADIPTDTLIDFIDENDNRYCYRCGAKMDGGVACDTKS